MVAGFRRSRSFSTPSPKRSSSPEKSHHVRSISLPCRSHPLISHLKEKIHELKRWESEFEAAPTTSAWLCDGLNRLKNVHVCLDDLLDLPQTQESIRRRSDWIENLLEDFLRFVDVYGIFRASLLDLKEQQLAAQVAIRKRDEAKIATYVKACMKKDKEMKKLVSVVRCIGKRSSPALALVSSDADAELATVLRDVNEVTVSVSTAIFNGISSSSSSFSSSSSSSSLSSSRSWMTGLRLSKMKKEKGIVELEEAGGVKKMLWWLRKKGDDEEVRMSLSSRLKALEDCIGEIERGSERVFRSLINTRVCLLNIVTQ